MLSLAEFPFNIFKSVKASFAFDNACSSKSAVPVTLKLNIFVEAAVPFLTVNVKSTVVFDDGLETEPVVEIIFGSEDDHERIVPLMLFVDRFKLDEVSFSCEFDNLI